MRGKPGYEHLNEPLHILVEAELPVEIVDARLMQAREILEDLLKPVVCTGESNSLRLVVGQGTPLLGYRSNCLKFYLSG